MDNKKKITFGAYISFGKCDSVDWEFDFEVTEEEHNRLLEAAKNILILMKQKKLLISMRKYTMWQLLKQQKIVLRMMQKE